MRGETGPQGPQGPPGDSYVYRGSSTPSSNILIWIDTSGATPSIDTQLTTRDGLEFLTSDNKNFILKEGN